MKTMMFLMKETKRKDKETTKQSVKPDEYVPMVESAFIATAELRKANSLLDELTEKSILASANPSRFGVF